MNFLKIFFRWPVMGRPVMVVIVRVLTINNKVEFIGGTEVGGAPINSSLRRRLSVDVGARLSLVLT